MGLLVSAATIIFAFLPVGLFAIGVAVLSYITYKVANWKTEEEYEQWVTDDILKKKGKDMTVLQENIKKSSKDEKSSSGKKKKDKGKKGVKGKYKEKYKTDEDEEMDPETELMLKKDKRKADVSAILNLPTY